MCLYVCSGKFRFVALCYVVFSICSAENVYMYLRKCKILDTVGKVIGTAGRK